MGPLMERRIGAFRRRRLDLDQRGPAGDDCMLIGPSGGTAEFTPATDATIRRTLGHDAPSVIAVFSRRDRPEFRSVMDRAIDPPRQRAPDRHARCSIAKPGIARQASTGFQWRPR